MFLRRDLKFIVIIIGSFLGAVFLVIQWSGQCDLFEDNGIPVQDAKIVLWTLLTAIYNNELVEEPERREIIISNIERQKDLLLINILDQK
jgi:hypothetical protein